MNTSSVSSTLTEALSYGVTRRPVDDRYVITLDKAPAHYGHAQPAWNLTADEWSDLVDGVSNALSFLTTVMPSLSYGVSYYVLTSPDGVEVYDDPSLAWADTDYYVSRGADRGAVTLVKRSFEGDESLFPRPTDGVLAWIGEGELFCADHGADLITDPDNEGLLANNGAGLDPIEYCAGYSIHGGHAFCGECGQDIEPKGHPDSGLVGNLFICDNCASAAVYVDGADYQRVDSWGDDILSAHNATVPMVDHNGLSHKNEWSIDHIIDSAPRVTHRTRFFVAFLDLDPSAGFFLILSDSWDDAWDNAVIALVDDNEDVLSDEDYEDAVAALQVREVKGDTVVFSSKG